MIGPRFAEGTPVKELDVRHLPCPGPVLELRAALEEGETEIVLHVADDLARSNVTRFAASRGATCEVEPEGKGFRVRVLAGPGSASPPPGGDPEIACELPDTGGVPAASAGPGRPLVVQVTGRTMGTGDDELGTLLLRSFLKTLGQLEEKPDAIVFYNEGVKLCCEGSELLDTIRELEGQGIEIIACGTCLNWFELVPRLAVGRGTDMLEIAERLTGAARLVRP